MKRNTIILILELLVLAGLMVYVVIRWNISKITVGDYFCLEAAALMSYYVYENFKTQKNGKE